MYAIEPLSNCPHCPGVKYVRDVDPSRDTVSVNEPCKECGNVGENMVCLTCYEVHCGRHVKQHMLSHHEATQHPLVVGFADLSCWCYPCEDYIDTGNPFLRPVYNMLYKEKFGTHPPGADGSAGRREEEAGGAIPPSQRDPMELFTVAPFRGCSHFRRSEDVSLASTEQRHIGSAITKIRCARCKGVFASSADGSGEGTMVQHYERTGHEIGEFIVGEDASSPPSAVWCYDCGAYVA